MILLIFLDMSNCQKLHLLLESMVGDVNLFLNNPDDITEAEIEVMVAGITIFPNLNSLSMVAVERCHLEYLIVFFCLFNSIYLNLFSL